MILNLELIKSKRKVLLHTLVGTLIMIVLIYFIRHEQAEILQIKGILVSAVPKYIILGLILSLVFIGMQGLMYQLSFKSVGHQVNIITCIVLYLKRFVVSIFLPGGGIVNLLFFSKDVEKEGVTSANVLKASSIFLIVSVATGILFMIPFILYTSIAYGVAKHMGLGLLIGLFLLIALASLSYNIYSKGRIYRFIAKKAPSIVERYKEIGSGEVEGRYVFNIFLLSLCIEVVSVAMVMVAFYTLGHTVSILQACIIYSVVLLSLLMSPFLKGVGAIELAMGYALKLLGFAVVDALAIAMIFRLFEFWVILLIGVSAFLFRKDEMIYRLLPPVLLMLMGFVNILSALTPSIQNRFKTLKDVIPVEMIHGSTYLTIVLGIIAISTSVYLIRGMKSAWNIAVILSSISLLTHISKGLDYEEAIIALAVLVPLIIWRAKYTRKNKPIGLRKVLPIIAFLLISIIMLATIGFYFLDFKHFRIDFTLGESIISAIKQFFLLDIGHEPITRFGREFLTGINILGVGAILSALFMILRPIQYTPEKLSPENKLRANLIVNKYGLSTLDYFKTYFDKEIFFVKDEDGFISYKIQANYAVVLENPVANPGQVDNVIRQFEVFCEDHSLIPIYYRISQEDKIRYQQLGKKLMPIGEEATVPLASFTLEGSGKKDIRNAISKLKKNGWEVKHRFAPHSTAFVKNLHAVSDEWLKYNGRIEIIFSQGLFDEFEIVNQDIFSIENNEGKVVAFINQIPGIGLQEANFDLMRKTDDAPNGSMDAIFGEMFMKLKDLGYQSVNLGMVPMSGMTNPNSNLEKAINLAYEKMEAFSHYKSLRNFKEKFDPVWSMKYLAYGSDYDLLVFPKVFSDVIKND